MKNSPVKLLSFEGYGSSWENFLLLPC